MSKIFAVEFWEFNYWGEYNNLKINNQNMVKHLASQEQTLNKLDQILVCFASLIKAIKGIGANIIVN